MVGVLPLLELIFIICGSLWIKVLSWNYFTDDSFPLKATIIRSKYVWLMAYWMEWFPENKINI